MDSQEPCLSLNQAKDQNQELHLQDKSEHLSIKVDYLETRVTHLSTTNTDLSNRLVHSEEEKLKISKELVEEKLHFNEMRGKFEDEMFELRNKLLNQKDEITELVTERDNLLGELQIAETNFKSQQEEYASLKKDYLALAEAHHKELAQSKELSAELLASAQAQDTLRCKLAKKHQKAQESSTDLHGELNRVRALIGRLLQNRVKLLGNQEEMKNMLEDLKRCYEEEQRKLKEKIGEMRKEQRIPSGQQKPSELSMVRLKCQGHSEAIISKLNFFSFLKILHKGVVFGFPCWCCQTHLKEAKEENSRLQLQVKELHQQYRAKLLCYLKDITNYIDDVAGGKMLAQRNKLRGFVDNVLGDVRASYRAREEQLATAAQEYKKKLQKTTKTHHALICTYRAQREQILAKPDMGFDPGPPDSHFNLLNTSKEELSELQQLGQKVEGQQKVGLNQVAFVKTSTHSTNQEMPQPEQIFQESWAVIKKQLKEITDSTLEGYEKERTLLITRATVAEEQVSHLQNFIDKHLHRLEDLMVIFLSLQFYRF
ncbi:coiled-coil domain-containing protein 78 [Corythoichthys intestinalis]|uniref:coiled-coil domain-containing protein 78 n=1 Tax=Corythoichthys intestinalis TaxID=161448 RepID=UPI0025A61D20|nr:coiled-coil domain-containing protein 78 [Corythoichthys intestinalis]